MNEDQYLEKMMEEQYRKTNERGYSKHKFTPDEKGYGPAQCVECDNDMHVARREYGFSLCVPCKEFADKVK